MNHIMLRREFGLSEAKQHETLTSVFIYVPVVVFVPFMVLMVVFGNTIALIFLVPLYVLRFLMWTTFFRAPVPLDDDPKEVRKSKLHQLKHATTNYQIMCLGSIFVVAWLSVRAVYFVNRVMPSSGSPCGRSSCTSDPSEKSGDVPPAVYNPAGYFNDMRSFDHHGVKSYMYCNFGSSCRWADSTGESVTTYLPHDEADGERCTIPKSEDCGKYNKLSAEELKIKHNAVVADKHEGLATKCVDDYPDPGSGLGLGYSKCRKGDDGLGVVPCPGNVDDAINGTRRGKIVCSTCAKYENTKRTLIGGKKSTIPDWRHADVACLPQKHAGSFLCKLACPHESESIDTTDLVVSMVLHFVSIAEAFTCWWLGRQYANQIKSILEWDVPAPPPEKAMEEAASPHQPGAADTADEPDAASGGGEELSTLGAGKRLLRVRGMRLRIPSLVVQAHGDVHETH